MLYYLWKFTFYKTFSVCIHTYKYSFTFDQNLTIYILWYLHDTHRHFYHPVFDDNISFYIIILTSDSSLYWLKYLLFSVII